MATSGKKGKKGKGKAVPLQEFLEPGNIPSGVNQIAKKVNYDADFEEEQISVQLPTGPRATREFDDGAIPHRGPYQASLSNLPFEAKEEDIYECLEGIDIQEVRFPRDDDENRRARAFCYVEFRTREDLISALRLPDPQIRNRMIRIELPSDQRRNNNRNRYDYNDSTDRDSNWRRGGDTMDREGRRGGYNNYRERDRNRDGSQEQGGSWRSENRPSTNDRPAYTKKPVLSAQERPKLNLKARTLPLPEIVPQPDSNGTTEAEAEKEVKSTTPEPEKPKPKGISAEKVFGGAKPVDTAAREREIEERLERERQEELKRLDEERKQEKEKFAYQDDRDNPETDEEKKDSKSATGWRRSEDDGQETGRSNQRRYSPDRRGQMNRRNDDRRGNNMRYNRDGPRERNFNRPAEHDNRYNRDNRDRNERYNRDDREYYKRDRNYNKDADNTRDIRPQEDRMRRENKPERPVQKYQPPQGGPVLSSSNKYGTLADDDVSE